MPEAGRYKLENAFPNIEFEHVIDIKFAPNMPGRLYAAELDRARILSFENKSDARNTTVLFELKKVTSPNLRGTKIYGVAFDPNFGTNRYFYVFYAEKNTRLVLARYTAHSTGLTTDLSSGKLLLEIPNPLGDNVIYHPGGSMFFDDHNLLYISMGDGGPLGDPTGRGQNNIDLHGAILRIDPHAGDPYGIPADNPFVGAGGGVREEIFAFGFRHPWRMSRDSITGDIWVGDVGDDSREEIDLLVRGGNYGWPIFEGSKEFKNPSNLPYQQFISPIVDYPHKDDSGSSVIGGYVYRGSRQPTLYGRYIYGDYVSGKIWAITMDGASLLSNEEIANLPEISTFGQDEEGELFVFSYGSSSIYRIEESNGSDDDQNLPQTLSKTGIFSSLESLAIAPEFVQYEVNSPLWSDGARKTRWIYLPRGETIRFRRDQPWTFPIGSLIVKHFDLETEPGKFTRLETRILFHHREGWAGYTYQWNERQVDATLLTKSKSSTYRVLDSDGDTSNQTWTFPGRLDCLKCHTAASGRILGIKTAQIYGIFSTLPSSNGNQLSDWQKRGMFSGSIGPIPSESILVNPENSGASIFLRAKSYLDSNCSHCHRPNGPTPSSMDLRFSTPVDNMNLLDISPAFGDMGISGAKLIMPGSKDSSVLWLRMGTRAEKQMPPLGTHHVDSFALGLIGQWVDGM